MRGAISVALACLFVFLAGFNLWNMLTSRSAGGAGAFARGARIWTQVHRAAGYAFITLFVVFCYFMLSRLKGWPEELSPQLILHIGLAFALAPLLIVKVLVARSQKSARGLLTALGVAIFAAAFSLVAINVSIHYLRAAPAGKPSGHTSLIFVVVALVMAGAAFFAKRRPGRPAGAEVSRLPGDPKAEATPRSEAFELRLARVEPQTSDAKTLRFLLAPGRELRARPGQFLTFEWIIDGKPVTRSYSICSSPAQTRFVEITAKRVENGYVSRFLNDSASAGLAVKARGPYGRFCFDENRHRRIVLIAGGSGITPIMAMLRYIDDLCIAVPATLIYCVRTGQDVFFERELAALTARLPGFRYVPVVSRAGAEWPGWKGRLRRQILEREVDKPQESTYFLCGPPAFMEGARTLLKEMGVEPERILQESFGGAVADAGAPIHGAAAERPSFSGAGRWKVRLARSGTEFNASPEDTLLDAAEKNGLVIPSGCRQGSCGTCAARLLSGEAQMGSQEALSEELQSEGYILPCVSRARSDITLDA